MSNPGAGYDFPVDVEAKITELRTKIREADHAYYVEANPVLGDAAYDRLLAELVDLERQHPELFDPNSPTVRVGGAPLDRFASQPHARPMLSLENAIIYSTWSTIGTKCYLARRAGATAPPLKGIMCPHML